MFDEVADFVAGFLVPGVFVVAGIDDEDIAFFDLDLIGDHFGGIEGIVADVFGEVDDDALSDPIAEGDISDGAAGGVEVDFAVHMGTDVVTGGEDLAIGALAHMGASDSLKVLDTQGHITGPWGGMDAEAHGEVVEAGAIHELQEAVDIH